LIHHHSGELFVFPLSKQQFDELGVKPTAGQMSLYQARNPDPVAPQPTIKLADLQIDDAQALDGSRQLTGKVMAELTQPYSRLTMRIIYRLPMVTVCSFAPLREIPEKKGWLEFSFRGVNAHAAGGPAPYAGPLAVFVDVCTRPDAAAPLAQPRIVISNPLGALVQVRR
jgi:hypothetical protein